MLQYYLPQMKHYSLDRMKPYSLNYLIYLCHLHRTSESDEFLCNFTHNARALSLFINSREATIRSYDPFELICLRIDHIAHMLASALIVSPTTRSALHTISLSH
eukprot:540910_1